MKAERVMPNVVTYTTIIDGYVKAGDFNKAETVVKEMIVGGVMPNVVTYNTIIGGYVKAGDFDKAKDLIKEIEKEGIIPDEVTNRIMQKIKSK